MARRPGRPLNGVQYCGNMSKRKVHNLDKEDPQCQIDEIIKSGKARPLRSLAIARASGYEDCEFCIGGSRDN